MDKIKQLGLHFLFNAVRNQSIIFLVNFQNLVYDLLIQLVVVLEFVELEVVRVSSLVELVLDVGGHIPLLSEDGEREVVQRGLAVGVQEIAQVAVALAVSLDQGVLVLPSLVWVHLIWRYVTYIAIFFIIDVSVAIVKVQLFRIFVFDGHLQKVLEQIIILGLDCQHQ